MTKRPSPNVISHEKAVELIRQIVKDRGSQLAAARHLDISPSVIGDILAGKENISDNVARKLGYRRVLNYEKLPEGE